MRSTGRRKTSGDRRSRVAGVAMRGMLSRPVRPGLPQLVRWRQMPTEESRKVLHRLREELDAAGREPEVLALDELMTGGEAVFLKLRKRWYTPAEVAERVGVSRQTVVKWIERGELDAELTPGGHHRIPASAFTTRRSVERADQRLVPARR